MKRSAVFILVLLFSICCLTGIVFSRDFDYKVISIEKISRYTEDRIAFQHSEADSGGVHDNSLSTLMIIDRGNIYLLKDGYDDPREIEKMSRGYRLAKRTYTSLYKNMVNSKPDYIKITERRVERMLNVTEEFVDKNFGDFYRKVRDAFLTRHVNVFKSLMVMRDDSQLIVEREAISPVSYIVGEENKEVKHSIRVSAKSKDDVLYYAEDADGDGVTETFTVNIPDGFHWGYKSGPNMIFIYKNQSEDIKAIIGKLAHDAYFGTEVEEKIILANFPPDIDIIQEHRLDQNPLEKVEKEKLAPGGN